MLVLCSGAGPVTDGKRSIFHFAIFHDFLVSFSVVKTDRYHVSKPPNSQNKNDSASFGGDTVPLSPDLADFNEIFTKTPRRLAGLQTATHGKPVSD